MAADACLCEDKVHVYLFIYIHACFVDICIYSHTHACDRRWTHAFAKTQ